MAPVLQLPAQASRVDLTGRLAVLAAAGAMALITAVDLLDGHLGSILAVGFVLVSATAALAVDRGGLLTAGVLPPLLLLATMAAVSTIAPAAIVIDGLPADAGWWGRTIGGTFDRGTALLAGYGSALAIIAWRSWDSAHA